MYTGISSSLTAISCRALPSSPKHITIPSEQLLELLSPTLEEPSVWPGMFCHGFFGSRAQASLPSCDAGNLCTGWQCSKDSCRHRNYSDNQILSTELIMCLYIWDSAALDTLLEGAVPICGFAFAYRSPGLSSRERVPLKLILYHLLKNMNCFPNREQLWCDIWILLVTRKLSKWIMSHVPRHNRISIQVNST